MRRHLGRWINFGAAIQWLYSMHCNTCTNIYHPKFQVTYYLGPCIILHRKYGKAWKSIRCRHKDVTYYYYVIWESNQTENRNVLGLKTLGQIMWQYDTWLLKMEGLVTTEQTLVYANVSTGNSEVEILWVSRFQCGNLQFHVPTSGSPTAKWSTNKPILHCQIKNDQQHQRYVTSSEFHQEQTPVGLHSRSVVPDFSPKASFVNGIASQNDATKTPKHKLSYCMLLKLKCPTAHHKVLKPSWDPCRQGQELESQMHEETFQFLKGHLSWTF